MTCPFPVTSFLGGGYSNSHVVQDNPLRFRVGGIVHFNCNNNKIIPGHDTMTCEATGTWSEEVAPCQSNNNNNNNSIYSRKTLK